MSEEYDVDESVVEQILDHYFLCLKDWIKSPKMPTIDIKYFGTFKPMIGKIRMVLRMYIYNYRKGLTSADRLRAAITRVWKVKQRLYKEKLKINQHKIWENMDPNELKWEPPNISDSKSPQQTETNSSESTGEMKS